MMGDGDDRRPPPSGERPAQKFRYSGSAGDLDDIAEKEVPKWRRGLAEIDPYSDMHVVVGENVL